jgi:hypothetical protein
MTKRTLLSLLFGLVSSLVVTEFWIRYFRFCNFNKFEAFNAFVHRYPLAGNGVVLLMLMAIVAGICAAWFRKIWILSSLAGLGTLLFIFSQIT